MGHDIVFYEHDVPYYASVRDLHALPRGRLELYANWDDVAQRACSDIRDSDVAIVTSYCPDSLPATELVISHCKGIRVFYDLDTPITLARLAANEKVPYIGSRGLQDFDLVLSYTGGRALDEFRRRLGAKTVIPLYGHVDPDLHCLSGPQPHYRADLSYLGTYSHDRQQGLEDLFVISARVRPERRFLIAGAQYPQDFPWSSNIYFVRHLQPSEHASFFCSSRLTLNVTRRAMAEMGWCPSGRLFEAAACGTPVLSDVWDGLNAFFTPGSEIIVAQNGQDTLAALERDDYELATIGRRARERTLEQHTSSKRAAELISILERSSRSEHDLLSSTEA